MCGIFLSLGLQGCIFPDEELVRLLKFRGPDSYQHHGLKIQIREGDDVLDSNLTGDVDITFVSSVLSLRGDRVNVQPFVDPKSGSVLCWNGEAWKFNDDDISGNDTGFIFERLLGSGEYRTSTNDTVRNSDRIQKLLDTLSSISGPFSFVFFDYLTRSILYGRDSLGRRSLLSRRDSHGNFMITSVCDGCPMLGWEEIEAGGVHLIELGKNRNAPYHLTVIPWTRGNLASKTNWYLQSALPHLNKEIPKETLPALTLTSKSVFELEAHLRRSMKLRLQGIPQPKPEDGLVDGDKPSKVAILFSGGVDCTVLARLAHDLLPQGESIDLLNAVFENPRIAASSSNLKSQDALYEDCPDRITARSSLAELRYACPHRTWRLVTINVPYTAAMEHRQQIISLLYPHNTEMDLSIAYALYFAARAQGTVVDPETKQLLPYTTAARVLFSGLGADELFGGYTRHATAFTRRNFLGLVDELEIDVNRLGKRNLGRDDRIISHWGREVRYPYLDESLLSWALKAPVWDKCAFGLARSEGPGTEPGKRVLRLLAWKLGMEGVAREKKRAIQFGARTAKMETGKKKGTELLS